MTAVDRDDKFHASYVPPPPPAPGMIVVHAPVDAKGRTICSDLHLTPEAAEQLRDALDKAIMDYIDQAG